MKHNIKPILDKQLLLNMFKELINMQLFSFKESEKYPVDFPGEKYFVFNVIESTFLSDLDIINLQMKTKVGEITYTVNLDNIIQRVMNLEYFICPNIEGLTTKVNKIKEYVK